MGHMWRRANEPDEEYNKRLREYMAVKYSKRRNDAIAYLGGKCVDCGTTEQLEFDHRYQEQKSFAISRRLGSAPWSVLLDELNKCDLRCESCHAYHSAFQRLKNFDALGLASRLK